MIDWNRVKELQRDFGEEDFAEIASMFLLEVQEKLEEMATGDDLPPPEDYHFLKGSAANLGFAELREVCSNAEFRRNQKDLIHIRDVFDASRREFFTGTGIDHALS